MRVFPIALQATLLILSSIKQASGKPRDDLGEWGDVFDMELIAIHAMLLPDAQVLLYGTDDRGKQGGDVYYEVWDPRSGQHERQGNHNKLKHSTDVNTFCTTSSLDVKTGNYVLMGGDNGKNRGIKEVLEFNTQTLKIRKHPKGRMVHPRWYATSIGLPSGEVFVVGGRSDSKAGSAICELWSPDDGFRELSGTEVPAIKQGKGGSWWYPVTYVNSSGDIVVIIANGDDTDIYRIEVDGRGSIEKVGEKPFDMDELSPAIMFEVDKLMLIATNGDLWIADISDSRDIGFTKKNNIGSGRTNAATNMLPDGRVIITGGSETKEDNGNHLDKASKYVQIWDPKANTVYKGPKEDIERLYHSSGLILPDGTVYEGGGGAPGPLKNLNGNIYKPGYLFDPDTGREAARPVILRWSQDLDAGESYTITVDDAYSVDQVTMTKPGSMTHARNCDHRLLDLDFDVKSRTTIEVHTPNKNIMIPGLWMVNTISDGVPSEGRLMGVSMAKMPHLYVPEDIDLPSTGESSQVEQPQDQPAETETETNPSSWFTETESSPLDDVDLLPLNLAGNNGEPESAFPLGQCGGDCDGDEDCEPGTYCFDDPDSSSVPGCEGERAQSSNGYNDYCTAYYA